MITRPQINFKKIMTKKNILFYILIIIFFLGLFLIGFVLNYFQTEAFVGCAKEYCPQEIIDEYYTRGGTDKGYWNDDERYAKNKMLKILENWEFQEVKRGKLDIEEEKGRDEEAREERIQAKLTQEII